MYKVEYTLAISRLRNRAFWLGRDLSLIVTIFGLVFLAPSCKPNETKTAAPSPSPATTASAASIGRRLRDALDDSADTLGNRLWWSNPWHVVIAEEPAPHNVASPKGLLLQTPLRSFNVPGWATEVRVVMSAENAPWHVNFHSDTRVLQWNVPQEAGQTVPSTAAMHIKFAIERAPSLTLWNEIGVAPDVRSIVIPQAFNVPIEDLSVQFIHDYERLLVTLRSLPLKNNVDPNRFLLQTSDDNFSELFAALKKTGQTTEGSKAIIHRVAQQMLSLTDEQLFNESLRSDSDVLTTITDQDAAVRMLLAHGLDASGSLWSRKFQVGAETVYLSDNTIEPSWVEVGGVRSHRSDFTISAFDKFGTFVWIGTWRTLIREEDRDKLEDELIKICSQLE